MTRWSPGYTLPELRCDFGFGLKSLFALAEVGHMRFDDAHLGRFRVLGLKDRASAAELAMEAKAAWRLQGPFSQLDLEPAEQNRRAEVVDTLRAAFYDDLGDALR